MLTDRFKALEQAIEQLPPDAQDALAEILEAALRQAPHGKPLAVTADTQAAIERALAQHAASLRYLKDR